MAISLISTLKCGSVVSSTGIEPNIYTLAIAPSAYGKSQVQKALEDACNDLEFKILGREPISDAGFLRALAEQPKQLLCYDEFGLAISEFANGKASYRAMLIKSFLNLFSQAGRVLRGGSYAQRNAPDILEPYLNLFCTTTGVTLYPNLSESFVTNGFFSRFLTFFSNGEERLREPLKLSIPEQLKDELVSEFETRQGSLGQFLSKKKIVDFSRNETYLAACGEFDHDLEKTTSEFERAFKGRSIELFTKLCLVTDADKVEKVIDFNSTAGWCFRLTEFCVNGAIKEFKENLGIKETIRSKGREQFQNLLKPGEELTKKDLTKRILNKKIQLTKSEKDEILNELCISETWIQENKYLNGSQKATTFYRLNS